jgi:hypothetical protein
VAIRRCPLCFERIPGSQVVVYSNEINCPGCKSRLEVSFGSRVLSVFAGLMAAAMAWNLSRGSSGMLNWILPIVYGFLTFSVVAAAFMMTTADLRPKPAEPTLEPVPLESNHARSATRH